MYNITNKFPIFVLITRGLGAVTHIIMMRNFLFVGILFSIAVFAVSAENIVQAEETYTIIPSPYEPSRVHFTNENWHTLPHPKVASFSVHDDGSASGLTETGIFFTQYNVPNSAGIRVQRFEIQDHYHYIIEGEPVYTFAEFSSRLALAYSAQNDAS